MLNPKTHFHLMTDASFELKRDNQMRVWAADHLRNEKQQTKNRQLYYICGESKL
jgi:hypothetical protein